MPSCGIDGCNRPLFYPEAMERDPAVLHRCGLHEIASYNAEELREWGEENAADMVEYARRQLTVEDGGRDHTARFVAATPAELDCRDCGAPAGEPCRVRKSCDPDRGSTK